MTTTTEKKAEPPKKIEKTTNQYSCQIVLEKTTKDKADDRGLPSDAFNVTYIIAVFHFLVVDYISQNTHLLFPVGFCDFLPL